MKKFNCPVCKGDGSIVLGSHDSTCYNCHGNGKVDKEVNHAITNFIINVNRLYNNSDLFTEIMKVDNEKEAWSKLINQNIINDTVFHGLNINFYGVRTEFENIGIHLINDMAYIVVVLIWRFRHNKLPVRFDLLVKESLSGERKPL